MLSIDSSIPQISFLLHQRIDLVTSRWWWWWWCEQQTTTNKQTETSNIISSDQDCFFRRPSSGLFQLSLNLSLSFPFHSKFVSQDRYFYLYFISTTHLIFSNGKERQFFQLFFLFISSSFSPSVWLIIITLEITSLAYLILLENWNCTYCITK